MPFAYLLRCADGSYYAGSTRDLETRVAQHNSERDGAAYTRRRRPVVLVWAAEFEHVAEAFAWEKRLQGWSRAKREALIEGRLGRPPGPRPEPAARVRRRGLDRLDRRITARPTSDSSTGEWGGVVSTGSTGE